MGILKSIIARVSMDGTEFEVGAKKVEDRALSMGDSIKGALKESIAEAFAFEEIKDAFQRTLEFGAAITDTSKRLNVSTTAAQEFNFAAKLTGTELDKVSSSLDRLAKGLVAMEEGTEEGAKVQHALARIGITADEVKGKKPEEVFRLIGQTLEGLSGNAEITATMMDIFGKSGGELIPMLKELRENIQRIHNVGGVLTPDAVKQIDEMSKATKTAEAAADGLFAKWTIGMKFLAESMRHPIDRGLQIGQAGRGSMMGLLFTPGNGTGDKEEIAKVAEIQKKYEDELAQRRVTSSTNATARTKEEQAKMRAMQEELDNEADRRRASRADKGDRNLNVPAQIDEQVKKIADLTAALDDLKKRGLADTLSGSDIANQIEKHKDKLQELQDKNTKTAFDNLRKQQSEKFRENDEQREGMTPDQKRASVTQELTGLNSQIGRLKKAGAATDALDPLNERAAKLRGDLARGDREKGKGSGLMHQASIDDLQRIGGSVGGTGEVTAKAQLEVLKSIKAGIDQLAAKPAAASPQSNGIVHNWSGSGS